MPRTTRKDAALGYAFMGMPVVPLWPDSKIPRTRHGVHDASKSVAKIHDWWRRWPAADLAFACGKAAGFDVLDVDPQHGGDIALARYLEAHGSFPMTACQRTPSGGFHLLFRHEPGLMNWSGGQGTAPRGLDCRTTGAMIRTWPTPGYHWIRFVEPDDLPPWPGCLAAHFRKLEKAEVVGPDAQAPRSVLPRDADRATRYVTQAIASIADQIAAAEPGCQEATLNASAFRAGRLLAACPEAPTGETQERLTLAGMRMANQQGRQPWQRSHVERVVSRGIGDGIRKGAARLPETILAPARMS